MVKLQSNKVKFNKYACRKSKSGPHSITRVLEEDMWSPGESNYDEWPEENRNLEYVTDVTYDGDGYSFRFSIFLHTEGTWCRFNKCWLYESKIWIQPDFHEFAGKKRYWSEHED